MRHLNFKHGHRCGYTVTPEYQAWAAMKHRCYNRNSHAWRSYGGRGVRVCKRWFHSFQNFLRDVGPKPGRGYDLDRVNPHGHYFPSNVKWRKRSESNFRHSVLIRIGDVARTSSAWGRLYGLEKHTVLERYRKGVRGKDLLIKNPQRTRLRMLGVRTR